MNSGTWYTGCKIAVDGSVATGWLDGVQKWKINRTPAQVSGLPDDGYRGTGLTGLVGLGTWNTAAEFDDVKVTVTAAPTVGETPTDANLATNGDFEVPDAGERFTLYGAGSSFGRWTVESGSVDLIGGRYWQAAHGKQSVDLSGNEPGTIFQDLRTKPGQRYILRFAVAGNPEADPQVKRMEVRWGGAVVDQISFDVRGHSNQSMGWLQREYKLLASAQTTRLAFKSLTAGANGPVVDDIQVTPASTANLQWQPDDAAVPLPPTPTLPPVPKSVSKPALDWVRIPAGNFVMGSSESDFQQTLAECQQTEGQRTGVVCQQSWFQEPQQTVWLGDFDMIRSEVTNAQYNLCVAAGVCQKAGRAIGDTNIPYDPGYFAGDFPVMAVSWYDADTFCRWAGGRLPTEAEWEKAARGTDGRRYPWGNAFDSSRANLASAYPAQVGNFPGGASPYGMTDMAGNVFEWTASKVGDKYVVRGGGWTKDYFKGRVTDRGTQLEPAFANYDVGFRCGR